MCRPLAGCSVARRISSSARLLASSCVEGSALHSEELAEHHLQSITHGSIRALTSGDSLSLNCDTSMATACMQQRCMVATAPLPCNAPRDQPQPQAGQGLRVDRLQRTVGMFILLSCIPTQFLIPFPNGVYRLACAGHITALRGCRPNAARALEAACRLLRTDHGSPHLSTGAWP